MALFIYPPTIDWSWMKQRPQQLMKQFSRLGHIVYYCNKTVKDLPTEQIEPNLHLVHHHERWLTHEWPQIKMTNQAPVIVWCSFPKLSSTLRQYHPDTIIYDCVDEFAVWAPYEHDMVMTADAIVCTAERLKIQLSRKYPTKPLVLVPNGYDPDMGLHHVASTPCKKPDDLPDGQLVGYIGAWAPWVDQSLVLSLPKHLNGTKVVIIGPEFGRKYVKNTTGVQFLGLKSHDQLPAYLINLSVCIIPFRLNPLTLSTNPVKAYEYLAAGKPVITTNLPECRRMQPYVDISTSNRIFTDLVNLRLQHPGDANSRIQYALNHTWEHRAKQIETFLQKLT
ncbi:Glycosyl transferases group 1 [Paenibacillus sp. yr247]|uniref:glycosyltransferase n=1 Tax=Paenibacillus sp. yr247 TaxID=1761880 RepID=UPI000887F3BD|nr:glycosyltransferase [Paenibacillus sp. yr247]SDO21802.1 Glycosyl transferases group 1 [Paenibacillus sp. yr247]